MGPGAEKRRWALNKFKIYLLSLGIRQYDLAGALGVQEALISHWATGRRKPKPEQVPLIAKALGVKVKDLKEATGWL